MNDIPLMKKNCLALNEKSGSAASILEALLFLQEKEITMGSHKEAEQNEIGGPVVFAILLLALVVLIIYFLG